MLPRVRFALAAIVCVALLAGSVRAGALTEGMKKGTPELKSAGPLTFGPEGILFIGDPRAATVFAIDTGDVKAEGGAEALEIKGIDEKVAGMLGTEAKQILITDLAVNPASGRAYLAVSRGLGPKATPVLLRVDRKGEIQEFPLKDVMFSQTTLPNATVKNRQEAITSLAYYKGKLFVAGLSNEEFASRFRSFAFPFTEADKGTGVEIFHGSHGRFETNAPIRTFVPYDIKGEAHLLAAYTCTPLVKVPISDLKPGQRVKGTTIAELGNRNRPLDMIVYQKDGKDFILMANSSRGLMKITTENIDKIDSITERVSDKAGLTYETIAQLKGVQQLAKLDKERALILRRAEGGELNLETIALP